MTQLWFVSVHGNRLPATVEELAEEGPGGRILLLLGSFTDPVVTTVGPNKRPRHERKMEVGSLVDAEVLPVPMSFMFFSLCTAYLSGSWKDKTNCVLYPWSSMYSVPLSLVILRLSLSSWQELGEAGSISGAVALDSKHQQKWKGSGAHHWGKFPPYFSNSKNPLALGIVYKCADSCCCHSDHLCALLHVHWALAHPIQGYLFINALQGLN